MAGDVEVAESNAAGVGPQFAEQLVDQGRFARAIRPDERVDLAGCQIEADVIGRDETAEPFREAANGEEGRGHFRPLCREAASATRPPRV